MIRYRCPHCAAVATAHERRAGQASVCKACLKLHTIPADQAEWLTEGGEPRPSPVVAVPSTTSIQLGEGDQFKPASSPVVAVPPTTKRASPEANAAVPEPAPEQRPTTPASEEVPPTVPAGHSSEGAATASPPPSWEEPAAAITPPPVLPRQWTFVRPNDADSDLRSSATSRQSPQTPIPQKLTQHSPPIPLRTQADITAALTAVLATHMKPPPAPRRDLRPSTALWILLTVLGVTLLLVSLFSNPDYHWLGWLVGGVQIGLGYAWIVRLTSARSAVRGWLCALPPLTLYYLAQYKYAKWRPLRFVVTGAILAALATAIPTLAPHTHTWWKPTPQWPVVPPDPTTFSKLEQLRLYQKRQSYDSLIKLLEVLAKTDPLASEDAKDRCELAAEIQKLCDHQDVKVRVQAMAAYARWDPDKARAVCLAAIRSPSDTIREMALRLLPQWKDDESARAVQSLIGRPESIETNKAKIALEEIGGLPAERAALDLLRRADNQATRLMAISILEKVGGVTAIEPLRRYALASEDAAVRNHALATVKAIETRLAVPSPVAPTP
ncbi:MAG: hypothetical protein RMJ56_14415 [Gemmataceae bacterium]|nr:hypothetical protein [Gemmata sp.]MDW8198787.1 hypothetical protein [Gemmataceae bacterium]